MCDRSRTLGLLAFAAVARCGARDVTPEFRAATDAGSIGIPRQIAPLSTSTVTTTRPTLHWQLPPSADGARVEICSDRACSSVEARLDVTGMTGRPRSALVAGVHFWRLRGMSRGVVGTQVSPTWEFWVGHRDTPVDSSWGSTLDVNGDGFADLAIGSHDIKLFLGSSSGVTTTASALFRHDVGVQYAASGSAGDINGDGFGDLVIVSANGDSQPGTQARVYLGSESGVSTSAAYTLAYAETSPPRASAAGDIDGDGYADLLVGNASAAGTIGAVTVLFGGPEASMNDRRAVIAGPGRAGDHFGWAVLGGIDVDSDGFSDAFVSAPGAMNANGSGSTYVYLGSNAGLGSPDAVINRQGDRSSWNFGAALSAAGDTNGDGYVDVFVHESGDTFTSPPLQMPEGWHSYLYLGGPSGIFASATADIEAYVTGAGDVNGDGFEDFLAHGDSACQQMSCIILGGPMDITSQTAAPYADLSSYSGPFVFDRGVGDLNRDGYADIDTGEIDQAEEEDFVYLGAASGSLQNPYARLDAL